MSNAIELFVNADAALNSLTTAPIDYAAGLSMLVTEGYAERLPMNVKGKPTKDVAEAKAELAQAYKAKGITSPTAIRNHILRATYAIHILAANPRRESETAEAFVTRCQKIRAMANAGDSDQIAKAIAGSTAKVTRKTKGPKSEPKAPKAPKAPEAPKPVTVADTHNALMAALSAHMDALSKHSADGGTITKAMSTAEEGKIKALLEMLAA